MTSPRLSALYVGICLFLTLCSNQLWAVTRSWEPAGGSTSWNSANNWDPTGVPVLGDFVTASDGSVLQLDTNTAALAGLSLLNGTTMATDEFLLNVFNNGFGSVGITGANTQLTVDPRLNPFLNSVSTDELKTQFGGTLLMQGGRVTINQELSNSSDSLIDGFGLIRLLSTDIRQLNNGGTIRASGGELEVRSVNGGTFDLDGSVDVTTTQLNAIDGTAMLTIDAPLHDSYDGQINIADGNTVEFVQALGIGNSGEVNISGGNLISGDLDNLGNISGHGVITTTALSNPGTISSTGGNLIVDSAAGVGDIDGTFNTGKLETTPGNNLTLLLPELQIGYAGSIAVDRSGFGTPNSSLLLNLGSSVEMTGALFVATGVTQNSSSTLTVNSSLVSSRISAGTITLHGSNEINGTLIADGQVFLSASASVTGNGLIIIDTGSVLGNESDVHIGVNINSQGTLSPGPPDSAGAARISLDSYTQLSGGTLRIELGGREPGSQYDVVAADSLLLDGTLEVVLIDGFVPAAPDQFDILEFDGLSGGFSSVILPPNIEWDTSQLLTSGLLTVQSGLDGDFNNDAVVNSIDYALWLNTLGKTVGVGQGADGNKNGIVDRGDYDVWKINNGRATNGNGGSIPEPSALGLLVGFVALSLWNSRDKWASKHVR